MIYNRKKSIEYAENWALKRNPNFYNFSGLGGDCTNYISQCLLSGGLKMDYSLNGWFYISLLNRAPAWTGVDFFYKYMERSLLADIFYNTIHSSREGDIIQFTKHDRFTHSLIITKKLTNNFNEILVCAHDYDSLNRKLSTYSFVKYRVIHIKDILE